MIGASSCQGLDSSTAVFSSLMATNNRIYCDCRQEAESFAYVSRGQPRARVLAGTSEGSASCRFSVWRGIMLYAKSPDGQKFVASPGAKGTCPTCGAPLIPKCGLINTWHWSHMAHAECDPWAEHETPWHILWKSILRPDACEVTKGPHRADIVGNDGTVIELQHSAISAEDIIAREAFYGKMIWLLDARDYADRFVIYTRFSWTHGEYTSFRWLHPKKSFGAATAPLFFDLGQNIFEVVKLYTEPCFAGWGHELSYHDFIARFLFGVMGG